MDGWGVLRSPTRIEGTVSDLELGFVLIGNVLPRGQENLPVWEEGGEKTDLGNSWPRAITLSRKGVCLETGQA